ncbi:MAG: hypothetical protein ORO03_09915, partial [Alphaproteobacteria bacterium]|nr:hypothetical protein [Alphaproteobacteria bacterium]
ISLNGAVTANSIAALGGSVTVAGALKADSLTGVGGRIQVTAAGSVTLGQGAVISANGSRGGGMISIGGDLHGAGATPNAQFVTVNAGAVISADGLSRGDGGTVAVWADQTTVYSGSITARGGATSGNGGFVETSGKGLLDFRGLVDTSAAHGLVGTLLLDPQNIEIKTAGDGVTPVGSSTDAIIEGADANANQTATGRLPGAATSGLWSALKVADLQTALNSNNVVVDAGTGTQTDGGHIKVTNAVSWTSGRTLTLKAASLGKITINASLTGGTAAKFIALAQAGIDVAAGVAIDMGTTGVVELYGRTGANAATSSSVNLQGTSVIGERVRIVGSTVSMVAGTGGVNIANATISGNLQLGHATGGSNPALVGNVVDGVTFTGSNRVTGNLVLGVAVSGDVSKFLLASGNSLTVDGAITSPNLSGAYTIAGALTVAGNVTLTGFTTNLYTPTSPNGVSGDIKLESYDKDIGGTPTNSLTVGGVTLAAGKHLTLTVDKNATLNTGENSSVGRLLLGNLTGGTGSNLTINLYSTAPDLQGSLVQNASTAIKAFGTLALNRGGNSLADLSSETNEFTTVQLNSGTLQELGALKVTSATSMTLTKINRDKAGTDTA